jgi:hypothetical protein
MQSSEIRWTDSDGWINLPADDFIPDLIIFFGSGAAFVDGSNYNRLRSTFPKAMLLGCSGGGQIGSSGIIDEGLTGIAMKFDSTRLKLVSVPMQASEDSFSVGASLGSQLSAPDLVGAFVLSEGIEINGDNLMSGLLSKLGQNVTIGGGLAADGARFKKTYVSANCLPSTNLVAAVGFYGTQLALQSSNGGGWKPAGSNMKITASRDNHLYDFDGRMALPVYKDNLGGDAEHLPMSGLKFPILVSDPNNSEKPRVRTLLGIDDETGILTFAGNVPEGWNACIMKSAPSDLIGAAETAARESLGVEAIAPEVSILVSCIGRRLVLKDETAQEVTVVKDTYPASTRLSGFYSYGEFSKSVEDNNNHVFNQSMTIFSMRETV